MCRSMGSASYSTFNTPTFNHKCKRTHALLVDGSLRHVIATTDQGNNLSNIEIRVLVGEMLILSFM